MEYMPLPRIWQWSLVKLKRRCKLAPQQAMLDISVLIDEILNDMGVFYGRYTCFTLVKINKNPQVCAFINSLIGCPTSL